LVASAEVNFVPKSKLPFDPRFGGKRVRSNQRLLAETNLADARLDGAKTSHSVIRKT
jgi:hypothetical protein